MKRIIAISFIVYWLGLIDVHAIHRALVFGLGKQEDARWGKIHGDNDIHYVVNLLQNMGFTDIKTVKNEQATKSAMVKAFMDLASRCNKGDDVYIHYSGHGQLMTDINGDESMKWNARHAGWDESWIPYDAYMTYCEKDRGEKHLCDDEVALLLQSIRKKIGGKGTLTVVVDACHSGDATCGDNEEYVRGVDTKFNIPKNPNTRQEQPTKEEWRTISACKPYQLSTEIKQLRVGKLTFALYSIGAKVNNLTNKQLEDKLLAIMDNYKGRLPQTPMVTGEK